MRAVLGSVPQMIVMASIVASVLVVPFGALLAIFTFLAFGVPVRDFMTFGGMVTPFEGAVAWWIVVFVPSAVYSACVMPWEGN